MSADRDIERLLDTWFADGPMQVSDHAFDEAVGRVHRQRQRPAWRLPWKEPHMSPLKVALGAAAIIVVFVAGFAVLGRPGGLVGGVAAPTATPSPTPVPQTLPDGSLRAGTYLGEVLPTDPMRWTVTVPAGWSGYEGWAVVGPEAPNDKGVIIAPILKASIPADSCATAKPVPATSVDELVAAVEAREDWVVSEPVDVTIDRYSGKRIDLELPEDVTVCGGNRGNYKVILEGTDSAGGWWAQGPSNRFNLWVLDVEGRPMVVMRNSYADFPAEQLSQSDDIINSIRITP